MFVNERKEFFETNVSANRSVEQFEADNHRTIRCGGSQTMNTCSNKNNNFIPTTIAGYIYSDPISLSSSLRLTIFKACKVSFEGSRMCRL